METNVQQLGIDIQSPPGSPKSWEQLAADVMVCVEPVREKVKQGGVSDLRELGRIQTACSAALLAALLRDIRVDVIEHGRLYIPADLAGKHGLDLAMMRKALMLDVDRGCDGDLRDGSCDCALIPRGDMLALRQPFRATMRGLVGRTHEMFAESPSVGDALPPALSQPLRRLIDEGQFTLRLIARHDYDTLTRRPRAGAFFRAWDRLRSGFAR